eukprot:1592581-Pyramimonas_sp.AAC.1
MVLWNGHNLDTNRGRILRGTANCGSGKEDFEFGKHVLEQVKQFVDLQAGYAVSEGTFMVILGTGGARSWGIPPDSVARAWPGTRLRAALPP